MSLCNSKRLIVERVQLISVVMLYDVVVCVVEGAYKNVHPGDSPITATISIDEMKAVGDFECDVQVLCLIVSYVLGCLVHNIVIEVDDRTLTDVKFVTTTLELLQTVERAVIMKLFLRFNKSKPVPNIDFQRLRVLFDGEVAEFGVLPA